MVGWVAAWWTTFAEMWRVWQTNDDYSHGPLVPVIAGYMIYRRRRNLKGLRIHPTWAGIVLLGLAFAMRFVGLYGWYGSLDRLSMIAGLAGVLLMVFGMDLLRRIVWPLAFLCLMFPLPNRVDQAVMPPMQMQAAEMGQWMTEMAGMEVSRLGNVLIVEGHPLEVARACNGLRLVFAFVALACCVAYLSKRPAWEKILIAASSLPIAVALNGFRVFAIGAVLSASDWQWSVSDVHDAWAWAMMPMALGLLLLEIGILNNLFIEQEERWQFNA
jgi:exosortase